MTQRQAVIGWCSFLALLGVFLVGPALFGQVKPGPAPETLLSSGTLIYVGWDGIDAHRAAWEKTAAREALVASGLSEIIAKVGAWASKEVGDEPVRKVMGTADHLTKKGLFIGLAVPAADQGPPMPQLTIVVPGAGTATQQISEILSHLGAQNFRTDDVDNRKVTRGVIPNLPAAEVGYWAEGTHLVIAAGIGAVDSALKVASGKSPNLSTSPVWKKYQQKGEFEQALVTWIDLATIRQFVSGFPVPGQNPGQPTRVGDLLATFGLEKIGPLAHRWGFRGETLWSETILEAPGPHTGVLGFAGEKALNLSELPALPDATDGFYASRFDWSKAAAGILKISDAMIAQMQPPGSPGTKDLLAQIKTQVGVDLQKDVFDPLGDVMVLYGDTRQGLFGMGSGLAISVDDAKTLRTAFEKLTTHLSAAAGREVRIVTGKKGERSVTRLEFPEFPVVSPSMTVDDKWLVIGLYPQTVDSFLLRQAGKLPKWEPSETVKKALGELPKGYTSLTYSDPKEGLRMTLGLAPTLVAMAQMGFEEQRRRGRGPNAERRELPISIADFPSAELVTQRLFPNVSVCTATDGEIRWTSRSSVPAIPFLGGAGLSNSGAAAPVLVALLLPAVQQAREAARRSQSMNNLKQMGLALHNYHDTHNAFPAGTHQNDKLKADKRLSWIADVLPYIDQAPLYNRVDFKKSWDDAANEEVVKASIVTLLNPGVAAPNDPKVGKTHYVGIAGIGKDAPTLPINDAKAGVFGYNRICGIRNITDGTSNTMGVTESSGDYGPWSAGGPSTIRALTKKPYINGPDGIGGPFRGGMNVLMMDGSVRFVSEKVDPTVLEALSTIGGGEVVNGF